MTHCFATVLLCTVLAPLPAMDLLLDAGLDAKGWAFQDGDESPHATGRLSGPAGPGNGINFEYDFHGGGSYVIATYPGPIPPQTSALDLAFSAALPCRVTARVRDASGRTFQGQPLIISSGAQNLHIALAGPWATAWGGDDRQRQPSDARDVSLVVSVEAGQPTNGSLTITRLSATSSAAAEFLAEPIALPAIAGDFAGWRLTGTWTRQWHRPVLELVAEGGTETGELTIALPQPARDWVVRNLLIPGQVLRTRLTPPLTNGGNPRSSYRLSCAMRSASTTIERSFTLAGIGSDPGLLGAAQRTRDLPPSVFGACLHLAFGTRGGAFLPWAASERLLDEVEALGLGWIRDGVAIDKAGDGYVIAPRDLVWLEAAKRRGLRTIIVLDMNSKTPMPELCARATALATQGKGLINVIELGNEPANFGGWVKTHGGTWNGMASAQDQATAAWAKVYLTATNAAAAAIKSANGAITVIGLGSVPPVNARQFDLGLSPAVDGVVDHPYSYSMPPEKVPFGLPFTKRDGVAVGDDDCSFVGLLDWYQTRFSTGGKALPVWISEFGWSTFRHDRKNVAGLYAGYTEPVQAAYLVRRHLLGAWHGVAVSIQYDLLDDFGLQPFHDESNFGLLRSDYSRKPAWYATQRLCSLFAGAIPDSTATATVSEAPLHRSQRGGELVRNWDGVTLHAVDSVIALPFSHPSLKDVKTLAVWTATASGVFNGRQATLRVSGWQGFSNAVCIGLCSGRIIEPMVTRQGDDLVLVLDLDDEPVAVRLFR